MDTLKEFPKEFLERRVEGLNIKAEAIGDQLNGNWKLLVFLRHLG
jgi:hypothetical protein